MINGNTQVTVKQILNKESKNFMMNELNNHVTVFIWQYKSQTCLVYVAKV